MALIKCPECGKEISDKAKSCIHCGCPISKSDYSVKIKIKKSDVTNLSYTFTDDSTGQVLAKAKANEVITLHLDKPTTIRCHFGMAKDGILKYYPHENARYNVVLNSGFFSTQLIFQEVDNIDSD